MGSLEEIWGFLGGSVVKNPPAKVGDVSSIPQSGRSPGEGNGNPFQYSFMKNPMDRGACGGKRVRHGLVTKITKQTEEI